MPVLRGSTRMHPYPPGASKTTVALPPSASASRVAYVLKMFPRLSETFILNEILELERHGLPLRIFSLRRPVDGVRHAQLNSLQSPVSYLPQTIQQSPLRIARAQWHVWSKFPRAWRHTLRHALRHARSDGDRGKLSAFYQACCVVRELPGLRHLHAHFANLPARVALLVHRLTGASYSITTHAKDIFQNDPFASPKLKERLKHARFVIANSRFSAECIHSHLNGEAQIHVVRNGLDLEAFPRRPSLPNEPLILSVGRLVEKKGFTHLVAACQILEQRGVPFSCELVGTGPLSGALKEQIGACSLGGRVRLLGPLPQQELRRHYERARVFALPCVQAADGDRDILPNAVKEAMAVGVPVVTSRMAGIEELVEDGRSGMLVEPGDVASLAGRLELLLGDALLCQRFVEQGRATIELCFDRRINFALLRKLLADALCTPTKAAAVASPTRLTNNEPRRLRER